MLLGNAKNVTVQYSLSIEALEATNEIRCAANVVRAITCVPSSEPSMSHPADRVCSLRLQ